MKKYIMLIALAVTAAQAVDKLVELEQRAQERERSLQGLYQKLDAAVPGSQEAQRLRTQISQSEEFVSGARKEIAAREGAKTVHALPIFEEEQMQVEYPAASPTPMDMQEPMEIEAPAQAPPLLPRPVRNETPAQAPPLLPRPTPANVPVVNEPANAPAQAPPLLPRPVRNQVQNQPKPAPSTLIPVMPQEFTGVTQGAQPQQPANLLEEIRRGKELRRITPPVQGQKRLSRGIESSLEENIKKRRLQPVEEVDEDVDVLNEWED